MSYPGLRGSRIYRNKYAGCEHSKVRGLTVRLLSPAEIVEFRAHIQRCINGFVPARRAAPLFVESKPAVTLVPMWHPRVGR